MADLPKILLIGAGRWGTNHLRAWLKLQEQGRCTLVGVQDVDEKRLSEISSEFSVETFSDDSAWELADAVDIAVPTYNHFDVAVRALRAGKDVMVEKPMTETLKQARELEEIHAASDQVFMVGHLFNYNPALDYAKKTIEDGGIGGVRFARGRFMGFRFKEHDAGILATTSIHFIYVANHIMGKRPTAVRAKAEYMLDSKLDDLCQIRLDYGPEFSIIESDYFTPGKWRTFDIVGTEGSMFVDLLEQKVDVHKKKHVGYAAQDDGMHSSDIAFQEPLQLELGHYLDCINERATPRTGMSEGIEVLEIIEAAYESSRTDKTIPLNPNH